jgi:hypothetical protein
MSDYQPIASTSDIINDDNLIDNHDDEQIKTKCSIISTNNISISTSIDSPHEPISDDRRMLSIDESSSSGDNNHKSKNDNNDHHLHKESPRINIIKPELSPRMNKQVTTPRVVDQPLLSSRSDHQDMPVPSIHPHNSTEMHPDAISPRSILNDNNNNNNNSNDGRNHHQIIIQNPSNDNNIMINESHGQSDDMIELIVQDSPRPIPFSTSPRINSNDSDNNNNHNNNNNININNILDINTTVTTITNNNKNNENNCNINDNTHDEQNISLELDTLAPTTSIKSFSAINSNDDNPIVVMKPTLSPKQLLIQRAKKTVEYYLEHMYTLIFMTIITIWALYDDDIRLSATMKSADQTFEIIISIIFFIFLAEIFFQCFYKKDYLWFPAWEPLSSETWIQTWVRRAQFGSFYFWLDWISTLSLLFEVIIPRKLTFREL